MWSSRIRQFLTLLDLHPGPAVAVLFDNRRREPDTVPGHPLIRIQLCILILTIIILFNM